MKENIPRPSENPEERKSRMESLAVEMFESGEIFKFPGMKKDQYDKLKAEYEEFPEFSTDIDEILSCFRYALMAVN